MIGWIRERPVLALVLLATALRVIAILLVGPASPLDGDFPLFDRMARNLIAQGDFGGEPALTYGSPNINPGFALWLALLYFLFGTPTESGVHSTIFWMAQVALGALTVYGSYLLASEMFGKKAGFVAGLITAIFPSLVLITVEDSNVLLYSALFVFSVFFFWRAIQSQKIGFATLSGALLGLAVLNESIAFYIPLVYGFYLFVLVAFRKIKIKTGLKIFSFLAVAFALTLAPWALRNLAVADATDGEVRIVSKGELQLVSPSAAEIIAKNVAEKDIFFESFKRMFLSPYGTWLLDRGVVTETLVYKDVLREMLRGGRFPPSVTFTVFLKTAVSASYWIFLILALYASLKFRRFGILFLALILYMFSASSGFVAFRGGNFDGVSHLSAFVVPLIPIFSVLSSASLTGKFSNRSRGSIMTSEVATNHER